MQRAYEYELQDKDDEIASLQNDYEASEYGYDDLQDEFEDLNDDYDKLEEKLEAVQEEKETLEEYAFGLKDALDKAGVYVELKQPSCLSRKELMNFYSRG